MDGLMLTTVKYLERMKGQDTLSTDTTIYIGEQGRKAALRHYKELALTVKRMKWTPGYRAVRIFEPFVDQLGMVNGYAEPGTLNLFYDSQTQDIPEVTT